MRKEIIGDCTLYCGDMREIIKEIGDVHAIISDPPYKLVSGGNTTAEMGGCFSKENYDNSGKIVECDIDWSDFMPLFYEALPEQAHAYVMANNRNVQAMLNSAEEAGFRFHNLLVWDKVNATPNRWYMKNCEFVGFFFKGAARYINNCSSKQLIRCSQVDESDHPTEKPVGLMEHYITNSTLPGDVILDPFMGSGSTGVAALKQGRKFIGIEINEKYFLESCSRIHRQISDQQMSLL